MDDGGPGKATEAGDDRVVERPRTRGGGGFAVLKTGVLDLLVSLALRQLHSEAPSETTTAAVSEGGSEGEGDGQEGRRVGGWKR